MQIQTFLLPKALFTHDSALCSRNTPGEEFINLILVISYCCSFFLCSQLFKVFFLLFVFYNPFFFFFSELGSNPLKTAGIDDGAFADLKRVSYIRIADTSITEIPKGVALVSISTIYSHIREYELILVLSSHVEPNTTIE